MKDSKFFLGVLNICGGSLLTKEQREDIAKTMEKYASKDDTKNIDLLATLIVRARNRGVVDRP